MSKDEKDGDDVAEILAAVSEHVPKLLNEITEALFNAEKTEACAVSVAKFYKSMIDAGMDEEKAFELTQKFMDSSSPGGMISKVLGEVGDLRRGAVTHQAEPFKHGSIPPHDVDEAVLADASDVVGETHRGAGHLALAALSA